MLAMLEPRKYFDFAWAEMEKELHAAIKNY
jgi:hypothetical protein